MKGQKKNPPWLEKEDRLLKENIQLKIVELAEIIGRSEASIRQRKYILGLKSNKFPLFTEEEKSIIKEWYTKEDGVDLEELSKFLHRPKTSISKIARDMGLTRYGNYTIKERKKRKESIVTQKNFNDIEHIRARFKGHRHSEESKQKMSERRKIFYSNIPKEVLYERVKRGVETKRKRGIFNTTSNAYSRCKGGFRIDLQHYFRSSWEANVARIFNYKNIKWKYETKRFDFTEENQSVLSYQPDFYLPEVDIWVEVKGWMDEKSKIRLELFKKYYPEENKKLLLIDSKFYYKLEKIYKPIITNWEYAGNYNKVKKGK